MRNKEEFLTDYNEVVKPEFQYNENVIEDAAHTLNHSTEPKLTITAEFTKTDKDETFLFEQKDRPKTDNPEEMISDWFYTGRGGE